MTTVEVATPEASVTAVFTPPAKLAEGTLPAGAVKVTVTPGTTLLLASVTTAFSVLAKGVRIIALCGDPPDTAMFAGLPGRFVAPIVAVIEPAVIVTLKAPATVLAVRTAEVAIPKASVFTVLVPPKDPLAPAAGTVKVTGTLAIGLLLLSFTSTTKGAV